MQPSVVRLCWRYALQKRHYQKLRGGLNLVTKRSRMRTVVQKHQRRAGCIRTRSPNDTIPVKGIAMSDTSIAMPRAVLKASLEHIPHDLRSDLYTDLWETVNTPQPPPPRNRLGAKHPRRKCPIPQGGM